MTCYFRHLQSIFTKAGIAVTKENKAQVDRIIHRMVGVEYKNCPAAWKQVKERLTKNEDGFASELRRLWNSEHAQDDIGQHV